MPFSTSGHAPLTNEQEKIEKANLAREVAMLRSQIQELESHKTALPDLSKKIADQKDILASVEKELTDRSAELVKKSIEFVVTDEKQKLMTQLISEKTTVIDEAAETHAGLLKSIEQAKTDLAYLLNQQDVAKKVVSDLQERSTSLVSEHEAQNASLNETIKAAQAALVGKQTELEATQKQLTGTKQEIETTQTVLQGLQTAQTTANGELATLLSKKASIATEIEQKLSEAEKTVQAKLDQAQQSINEKEKALAEREGLASLKEKWTKDVIAQGKAATSALENHYHLKSPIDLKWPE